MTNDAKRDGSAVTNGDRADRKTVIRLLNGALELVGDRARRIDSSIDYFGSGDMRRARFDTCGEALLDGDGAP